MGLWISIFSAAVVFCAVICLATRIGYIIGWAGGHKRGVIDGRRESQTCPMAQPPQERGEKGANHG